MSPRKRYAQQRRKEMNRKYREIKENNPHVARLDFMVNNQDIILNRICSSNGPLGARGNWNSRVISRKIGSATPQLGFVPRGTSRIEFRKEPGMTITYNRRAQSPLSRININMHIGAGYFLVSTRSKNNLHLDTNISGENMTWFVDCAEADNGLFQSIQNKWNNGTTKGMISIEFDSNNNNTLEEILKIQKRAVIAANGCYLFLFYKCSNPRRNQVGKICGRAPSAPSFAIYVKGERKEKGEKNKEHDENGDDDESDDDWDDDNNGDSDGGSDGSNGGSNGKSSGTNMTFCSRAFSILVCLAYLVAPIMGNNDNVNYMPSTWPDITTQLSYESADGASCGNWRELCLQGGLLGEARDYPCQTMCDAEKCQSEGSSAKLTTCSADVYASVTDVTYTWNADTVRSEIHIAGAGGSYSTGGDLLAVARCDVHTSADADISRMEGQIIEITYIDSSGDFNHVYNTEMVAAHGYQQTGNAENITDLPTNIAARQASVQSNSYDTCDGYVFDTDSKCCSNSYWGDVSGDCKTTAWDAQVTMYYTSSAYVSIYDLVTISSMDDYQRYGMDLTLDYLDTAGNAESCLSSSYSLPCPTEKFDITYLLRMVESKYMALDISSGDEVITQTNARFYLTGHAPFLMQDDADVFNIATGDDAVAFFEIANMSEFNRDALINGLVIGSFINTTSDDHVIIRTEYNVSQQEFLFQSIENFTAECFEVTIMYRTLNEDGNSNDPLASDGIASDRYYAYHGTDYFPAEAGESPYNAFGAIFEICIESSGETLAPTLTPTEPQPSASPTRTPTLTPTQDDPAPELQECRFEDHGTAIWVKFDEPTNRAGYGGEPFSCLQIFTPPTYVTLDGTGGDSRCIWVNTTTVRIELGYGCDVRVDDYLELVGNNIYDVDENSPPATGLCQVDPAYHAPDEIDVRISGSQYLGKCQDLELNIDGTMGLFPPIDIAWSINPAPVGYTPDKTTRKLSIPSEYLTSTSYTIGVTVSSRHGYTGTTDMVSDYKSLTIYKSQSDEDSPQLSIDTPMFINVASTDDLVVTVDASINSCKTLDAYMKEWSQGTQHKFRLFGPNSDKDNRGFITNYDMYLEVAQLDSEEEFEQFMASNAADNGDLTSMFDENEQNTWPGQMNTLVIGN